MDELVQPYAGQKIQKGGRDRGARLYPRRRRGPPALGRLHPDPEEGKAAAATLRQTYALEYGEDEVEIHLDALQPGENVLVVDDLIATGGTAEAAIKLLRRAGAEVVGAAFAIDLPDLGGAARIEAMGVKVQTLVKFPGH